MSYKLKKILRNFPSFFIYLILFSCTDRSNVVSYNEIDIVRTSRDSSYLKDGLLYTGQIKKIIDNKELLSFSVIDGKIDGKYIEYYPGGLIKNISNYKNGILDGKYNSYYQNNLLMEEYQYKNGLMEGKRILYWTNGNLKEKNFLRKGAITGVSEFYYSNGNPRKIISFDIYGRRDGEWVDYYFDGKIKLKVVYNSGKLLDSLIY